jgi:hypothetical protein
MAFCVTLISISEGAIRTFAKVAVIAKIQKIESRFEYTKKNEEVETKIGFGQCLDILYRDERALEDDEL